MLCLDVKSFIIFHTFFFFFEKIATQSAHSANNPKNICYTDSLRAVHTFYLKKETEIELKMMTLWMETAYSTVSSSRLAAASSALSVCLHIEGLKHVIEG